MKYIITITLLFLVANLPAQDRQAWVEVKDTVETAYHTYYGNWGSDGLNYTQKIIRDSIGVDSVTIIRIYYLEWLPKLRVRKIYLDIMNKKYKNGNSNQYDRCFNK